MLRARSIILLSAYRGNDGRQRNQVNLAPERKSFKKPSNSVAICSKHRCIPQAKVNTEYGSPESLAESISLFSISFEHGLKLLII